jgi:hypothetical protein
VALRVEYLEFLSEVRRVEQLHERQFSLTQARGLGGGDGGEDLGGVADEKGFLRIDLGLGKAMSF